MGPAKPDHDGLHLSATRVDTFKKCERKWAFEYIAHVPYPPSPWLAFGTLFHAHLERYFKDGALPDLSWLVKALSGQYVPTDDEVAAKLAAASLVEWPKYEPGRFAAERPFSFALPWGIFTGTVDLPDLWIRRVGDHKSTVALKWAPTVDELLTWPQPVAYSYHTARELGWQDSDCRWVYTEKGSGLRKVVQTPKMPFSYWEDQWGSGFLDATKRMAELYAQRAVPMELSPAKDTSFCHAYGGCPFRGLCTDVDHSSALLAGFDDTGVSTMSDDKELDALFGTPATPPPQEVGDTTTKEAPADLSVLDDLLNPPAGGGQAAVASGAPPLADPKPTTETTAKAAAETAAKPKKVKAAKSSASPEGAAALAALKEPEIIEGPRAVPGAQTKVLPAPRVSPMQAAADADQHAHYNLGLAAALLVRCYLDPQNALGKSGGAASGVVQSLAAQGFTDNDLIIRAIDAIMSLRRAFGDDQ